jgi:antitoxin (DNA-binding transcriptional repressor) of toxin-antitoxin stability system
MTIITAREAKTQLARLLRQLIAAGGVVSAKAGVPLARLLPLAPMEPRRPDLARGRLTEAFFEPLPADELAGWQQ